MVPSLHYTVRLVAAQVAAEAPFHIGSRSRPSAIALIEAMGTTGFLGYVQGVQLYCSLPFVFCICWSHKLGFPRDSLGKFRVYTCLVVLICLFLVSRFQISNVVKLKHTKNKGAREPLGTSQI